VNAPTKGDMGCVSRKKKVVKGDNKSYVNAGNKGFLKLPNK
jgi:hypothetical protein